MSTLQKIIDLFEDFGIETSEDLESALGEALRKGGRRSPQTTRLRFEPKIKLSSDNNVGVDIAASGKHWRWIESGRRAGAKRVPADRLGKLWQNENNIDPRKSLKRPKMDFEKAARSLSFVIQRAIFKRGIKPKPFIGVVINDGRIQEFRQRLTPLLGEHFLLSIKGLE